MMARTKQNQEDAIETRILQFPRDAFLLLTKAEGQGVVPVLVNTSMCIGIDDSANDGQTTITNRASKPLYVTETPAQIYNALANHAKTSSPHPREITLLSFIEYTQSGSKTRMLLPESVFYFEQRRSDRTEAFDAASQPILTLPLLLPDLKSTLEQAGFTILDVNPPKTPMPEPFY